MTIQKNARLRDVMEWMPSANPSIGNVCLAVHRLEREAEKGGVTLYPQRDFDLFNTIMRANKDRRGYINPIFENPPRHDAFWIAGLDASGGIATVQAGRLFHWQETNLLIEAEALRMHYAPGTKGAAAPGEFVEMGCPSAEMISGEVMFSGGIWIRPDFCGPQDSMGGAKFSQLLARLTRFVGLWLWPLDYSISSISNALYDKGVHKDYGNAHCEAGIRVALQFLGEGGACLLWSSRKEIEDAAERVLSSDTQTA